MIVKMIKINISLIKRSLIDQYQQIKTMQSIQTNYTYGQIVKLKNDQQITILNK